MPILLWGARKTLEFDQVKLDSYKVVLYRQLGITTDEFERLR